MAELRTEELRELLAGTWIGMACLAELLVQGGTIPRGKLLSLLAAIEGMADDPHRRSGIAGLRRLIESAILGHDRRFSDGASLPEVVNQIFDKARAGAAQEAKASAELAAYHTALQFQPTDSDHEDVSKPCLNGRITLREVAN